jgi:dynamin 1-like protein
MNHISDSLPNLKLEVANKLSDYQKVHDACGEEVKDRDKIIVGIVTKMTKFFSEIIDGKSAKKITDVKALCGGPKFRRIFDESFTAALIGIEPQLSKKDIVAYISNNGGPRPAVFAPENLFEKLVNEQIERLREPALKCVENSYDEMGKVILKLVKEQHVLARFNVLEKKIYSVLKNFLNERLPAAKNATDKLIDTELSSINTNHPDFSIEAALKEDTYKSVKIEKDAEIIEHLVKHYFPIVKKTIQDQIPKIIMHEMIKYMKDNIESELLGKLYKENQLEMLQESEENAYRRENAKAMIKALRVAKETIEEIELGY